MVSGDAFDSQRSRDLFSPKRPKEQVLRVDHRRAALAGLVTRDENDPPRILRIPFKPYTVQTSFVSTASGARALFFLYLFSVQKPSGTAEAVPFHNPLLTTPFHDREAFLLLRFQ
jgi:hypothetical protein